MKNLRKYAPLVVGMGGLVMASGAHAAAEAWATSFATFLSGAGLESVQAWLGAAVVIIGAMYVFRKVAGR